MYGEIAESILATLRGAEATVYDSAALLVACYASLSLADAQAGDEDSDATTILAAGGATVIDPLDFLDDAEGTGPAAPTSAAGPQTSVEVEGEVAEQELPLELSDMEPQASGGIPLTPEEIRRLIEEGVDLRIGEGRNEPAPSLGLYITDLLGKLPAEQIERLRELIATGDGAGVRSWLAAQRGTRFHHYDEWDYLIADYRRRWCRLSEHEVNSDGGRYYNRVLVQSADLVQNVRR